MADKPYTERLGGSYVKQPDGTLKRVEATEPAPAPKAPDAPAATPAAETTKKGK